jgi:hypothetical protein
VKDERSNLNAMTFTLKVIVSCDILGLKELYQNTYFGHAFFKACQYATTYYYFCKNLTYVFIKTTQRDIHKCITWPIFLENVNKSGPKHVLNLV